MNRLPIIAAAVLFTLPAIGQQKPENAPPAPAQTSTAAPAAPVVIAVKPVTKGVAPAATDSPLVAAAKRSSAARKKSTIVITNDTLRGQNAKVTTTASQPPLGVASTPPSASNSMNQVADSMTAIQKAKDDEAAKKKAAADEALRTKRMEELRNRVDDDSLALDVDPSRVEHQLDQTSTQGQQPPPPKKP